MDNHAKHRKILYFYNLNFANSIYMCIYLTLIHRIKACFQFLFPNVQSIAICVCICTS